MDEDSGETAPPQHKHRHHQTSRNPKFDKSTMYTADEDHRTNCFECCAIAFSAILFAILFPIFIFFSYKVVREYQRAVIFRMGRICGGAKGPGSFFVLPCVDEFYVLDLRTVTFDVKPQEILSRDSVGVMVDAVVYYRIFDPVMAVVNVANYQHATQLLACSVLRNTLGTRNLHDILTDRESITQAMQVSLDEATDPWGVKVERIEIKDVRLPASMARAMAAEAEASREANAKVISAQGEMNASNALMEAANILSKSGGALQLRYLQTLSGIAAEKNSTIIFPLPLELLSAFSKK